jgi:glutathione S-transferase
MTELEGPLFRWLSEGGDDVSSGAAERFAAACEAMESALGNDPWLVGGRLTVADVLCASVLAGAHSRGLLSRWPGLEAYVMRSEARPAYARAAGIWDRPRT